MTKRPTPKPIISPKTQRAVVFWAYALDLQVTRLHQSCREVVELDAARRNRRTHVPDDNVPFLRLEAEAHFTIVAAAQLLRALANFDGDLRLPPALDSGHVRLLRNALEHWDEPAGLAQRKLAALGAKATSHEFDRTGTGVVGNLISDRVLQAWARQVLDQVLDAAML
jgi:hypothetical protein